jgi:dynein heavy chain
VFKDPLFQLQLVADLDYDAQGPRLEVVAEEVPDYKFPQAGEDDAKPEDFADYGLLTYPFLISYDVVEDFNEHQKKFCEYCEPRTFTRRVATNIHQVALSLSPSLDTIKDSIDRILSNGLSCLQAFESFVQHPNMKKYSAILEEWEEHDDNRHAEFENTLLNPEDCIDAEEKRAIERSLKGLFEQQFEASLDYLAEFRQFLQLDWEYNKLDVGLLVSPKLAKPGLTFNALFNLLEHHRALFEGHIPYQADIGIFRVVSRALKADLAERPKRLKEKVSSRLLEELQDRVALLREWFDDSSQRLKLNTTDIEMFVLQSGNLKEVERHVAYYKDFLKTTKEVIETIRKFQIEIKKDFGSMFTEVKNFELSLAGQLVQVNDNIVKNQEIFSANIRETATPALLKECQALEDRLADPKYFNIDSANVVDELRAVQSKIDEARLKADKLNSFEGVLGLPKTRFDVIKGVQDMVSIRLLLWTSFKEWFEQVDRFRESPFNDIRVEEIQEFVEKYQRNLAKCRKQVPPGNAIVAKLDTEIKGFSAMLPIVIALRNPKLRPSHMVEIQNETRIAFNLDDMRLQDLLREEILEQQGVILGISVQVTQEANLKLQLNEIEEKFNALVFPVTNFKEDSPKDSTYVLDDTEPMMAEIDRLIMLINGVYGSRYLKEHKKAAADKRKEILTLQEMMLEWIKFQKSYIYLESIFSQAEIKKPLQLEAKEFEDSVNKVYKQNAKKISTVQYVSQLARNKHLDQYLATFRKQNEVLHELNKKLNNFLDQKREAFPRFYFVSNDELVFILANNDSPSAVQTFMSKLFENVHRADFGPDPRSVTMCGLVSREGETLPFKIPVSIKGDSVEKWMKKVEESMFDAVFRSVKEGFTTYADLSRQDWYLRTSAQGLSVISQLAWTMSIEDVLKNLEKEDDDNADMADVLTDTQKNLELLTRLVRESLPAHQHQALVAVITTEVHNRDVIELLVQREVCSRKDFLWKQQLRCYFEEGSDFRTSISIVQIEAKQRYGFEYYGPASRIVVTPLTERCWITITSALQMSLGAAPAGPAGTGKTESVKDLAKSLARFCIVFNCSDQIDYLMMEKLFRGVIKQGAWTCLDEFNRIDIEVLSVVAQQLLEMRLALLSLKNDEEFTFCSAKCRLNDTCGVFITMNPGYAGRTELPENLKSLFRPIAMMIPDYTLISQILLFSEGFLESKVLAAKMIKLYKLASEQLSQQRHYDFGMRAVKCVLEMSGKLKRQQPDENEQVLLIKALRDSNLPKFLKDDVPLFEALLNDLFPAMRVSEAVHPLLQREFDQDLSDNCLVNTPAFNQKLLQLSSTLNVRFGTIVVGHALNGKTTLIGTLQNAINALAASADPSVSKEFPPVSCVTINPKSVTMGELYGEENALTKDWADGIASFYIRQATNATDGQQKWICFDGPVDSLWIENMNSVLDDSRLLCLANGQRIRLSPDMRILFEVDLLDEASPATISRCGMVYVAEQVLGWQAFLKSWVARFGDKKNIDGQPFMSPDCRAVVDSLFANHLESLAEAVRAQPAPVEMVVFQNVKSALGYFECFLTEDFGFKPAGTDEYKSRYVMAAFIMAIAWAFTGQLQEKEAERVDSLIKKKFPTYNFPNDLIVNCFLDTDTLELRLYSDVLDSFEVELAVPFWDILVPTVDTAKINAMARLLLRNKRNVFLTGSTGTGKSVLVSSVVRALLATHGFDAFRYNFSAKTSSKDLQESLMSSLFLLSQKSRGARFGRQNLIVIDDVNMPAKEPYGAQPPIELMRLFVDKSCLFDRKEMHKVVIQDTQLLVLGAPPEGGRNVLSRRFVRHFDTLCFPRARSQTILRIFNTIMSNFLFEFEESVRAMAKNLVSASISLYDKILAEKLPTPSKFFYTFNLRDLSKTFMGVMKADKSVVREARHIVRLWAHETYRVFADRLNCQEDRDWFDATLKAIADSSLGTKGDDCRLRDLLFTDLFTAGEDEAVYEEVVDEHRLAKTLEDANDDFNDQTTAKMSLVFFKDATAHVLRLYRVLRQSRGSAMLVGIGGLGKTCVTRMASFLTDYQVMSIEEAKGAVGDKFKEWLRKSVLLKCAGPDAELTGRSTTFMISESFIRDENLFEDINNLLNSGEVPNIFPKDEREKLEKGLVDMLADAQVPVDPNDVWKVFVERVRDNLHIVLCMSPVGNGLRVRCRRFPALVDCTTIDWFENWPGEAIESVAEKLIDGCGFDNHEDLARLFKEFHDCSLEVSLSFTKDTNRCFFITPKLALDNISLFVKLFKERREALERSKDVFTRGSVKLDEMTEVVKVLRVRLVEAQPLLEEQRVLAGQKLVELEASAVWPTRRRRGWSRRPT